MKKGNFLAFFLEIQKNHFFIPNVKRKGVVFNCTRVLSVSLLYYEVVEKICLGRVFKKKLYNIGYTYYSLHISIIKSI